MRIGNHHRRGVARALGLCVALAGVAAAGRASAQNACRLIHECAEASLHRSAGDPKGAVPWQNQCEPKCRALMQQQQQNRPRTPPPPSTPRPAPRPVPNPQRTDSAPHGPFVVQQTSTPQGPPPQPPRGTYGSPYPAPQPVPLPYLLSILTGNSPAPSPPAAPAPPAPSAPSTTPAGPPPTPTNLAAPSPAGAPAPSATAALASSASSSPANAPAASAAAPSSSGAPGSASGDTPISSGSTSTSAAGGPSSDDPKVWLAALPSAASAKLAVRGTDPADTALRQQAALGTLWELVRTFNSGANRVRSAGARYLEYYNAYNAVSPTPLESNRYYLLPSFRTKVITDLLSKEVARAYAATPSYQHARDLAAQNGGDPGVK